MTVASINSEKIYVELQQHLDVDGKPQQLASSKQPVSNDINVDSVKTYEAVDQFLNLGNPDRLSGFFALSPKEQEQFAEILAKMIQKGIIGYEMLDVEGSPQRVDLALQIGEKITYYNSPVKQQYS